MNKAELVKAINELPGEQVTLRPRKATLEAILEYKMKMAVKEDVVENKTNKVFLVFISLSLFFLAFGATI